MKFWNFLRRDELLSLISYALGGTCMLLARDFTVLLKLCCVNDLWMLYGIHFSIFVALGAMTFGFVFWRDRRRAARKAAEDAAAF